MQIFLATHGKMAEGMKTSLDILLGGASNLTFFNAYVDDRTVESQVEAFLAKTSNSETRVLVSDIYGGSVCQVLMKYMDQENTLALTGINLGLLLSLVLYPEDTITKEELQRLIDESKQLTCIIDMEEISKYNEDDDIF
ncbi:MAG: hypothetical protein IJ356_04605 [Erysipelotrichaceae bacterium]|nr:hypothetical protein [Erysipelotrichaceae bacterium]